MEKEKKIVGVGTVAFNIGIFTIAYSWLLSFIPAMAIQGIFEVSVEDFKYKLYFMPFQIVTAILGNILAVKKATKGIDINGTLAMTILISVLVPASILFLVEIVIGISSLVPFGSILGFNIILITYIISNYFALKKVFK